MFPPKFKKKMEGRNFSNGTPCIKFGVFRNMNSTCVLLLLCGIVRLLNFLEFNGKNEKIRVVPGRRCYSCSFENVAC